MKKTIASLVCVGVMAIGGVAHAQSLSGSSGALTGSLNLRQTLTSPLACSVNSIPYGITGGVGQTTANVTPPFNRSLCTGVVGLGVKMLGNWTITATGGSNLLISGVHVQALSGVCGGSTASITGTLTSANTISIPFQTIPGTAGGSSVPCELEGTVVSSSAITIIP